METRKFSAERLHHIRRLRKARRLFKQVPLFAYQEMLVQFPEYSYEAFTEDLRRRSKPKKRKEKYNPYQWGRYRRIETLMLQFRFTKDFDLAKQAIALKSRLTKPYQVCYRIGTDRYLHQFSPRIPIEEIESLVTVLALCKTIEEAEHQIQKINNYHHY